MQQNLQYIIVARLKCRKYAANHCEQDSEIHKFLNLAQVITVWIIISLAVI
jgi:hypothetical protein